MPSNTRYCIGKSKSFCHFVKLRLARESFVRPRGQRLLKIRDSRASVEKQLVGHRAFPVSFCPTGGPDIRRKAEDAQVRGGACASV